MRGTVTERITSLARRMIRRQDRQDRRWRLPSFAAVCLVIVGIALSSHASGNGDLDGNTGSLAMLASGPGLEIDRHQGAPAHGDHHCLAGPSCASAVVSPEPVVLRTGKNTPSLVRADLVAHERHIRPPLHPPNSAVHG